MIIQRSPGAGFRGGVRRPVPNVELPAHVVAEEDKLTFFADFAHVGENGVPLYLVNRTRRALHLDTQDLNPYIKLEYRDEQGRWIRAQPHLSSWCGNSYYFVTLEAGQHFHFYGYQATEGSPAAVRYRSDQNKDLVSNVGIGRINPVDLEAASLDDMAAASIPWGLREVLDARHRSHPNREVAPARYVSALRLLARYCESAYYRREAKRYLDTLDSKAPEGAAILSLLEQPWPAEADRIGLLKHLDVVISSKEAGDSPDDKELALKVVRDLLLDERHVVDPEWKKVVRRIYEHIGDSIKVWKSRVADAAAEVIAVTRATDEFVETNKLREWIGHGNGKVVEASANTLSRRRDWGYLADKGFGLTPEARILILKALATGGDSTSRASRNPDCAREVEFWKHCATEQPVKTVQALQYVGSSGLGRHSFNMVLHEPLRAFLEKEAGLAENDPQAASNEEHGYPLAQVIQFVGAWKRKEDIPLFLRFLQHPGFQSGISHENDGRRFEERRFRVRGDASQVLHSLRVSVPDDIVYVEKIPLPDEPGAK